MIDDLKINNFNIQNQPFKKWPDNAALRALIQAVAFSAIVLASGGVGLAIGNASFGMYHLFSSPNAWADFALLPFVLVGAITGSIVFGVGAVKAVWSRVFHKLPLESQNSGDELKTIKNAFTQLAASSGVLAVSTVVSMVALVVLYPLALVFGEMGLAAILVGGVSVGVYSGVKGFTKLFETHLSSQKETRDPSSH